ncbi:MAG: anti-sigma factor RsbA family regulatory protein [Streptosporangiaceae bacterium]
MALLADGHEVLPGLADFVLDGITSGQDVLIALPAGRAAALRDLLGSHPQSVLFADPADLGRNPAKIIPALQSLAAGRARPVRFVTEPIWAGRTDAEIREVLRYESLANRALAGSGLALLCAYDTGALSGQTLTAAGQTHPVLVTGRRVVPSMAYQGPAVTPPECDRPLEPPPPGSYLLSYGTDLRGARDQVARRAAAAGLSPARVSDLVHAVGELMANTLTHTADGGTIRLWLTPRELICQVDDGGQITDPLVGHRLPDPARPGGQGLWLVNQYCDLAEVRSGPRGTTFRLHMRRDTAMASGRAAGTGPLTGYW